MIYHHLEALAKVPSIKQVLLVGFFDESVFKPFIQDAIHQFTNFQNIQYLREYQALGTAGGLYHFRDTILRSNPTDLFVLHADVCCSFPLEEMQKLHHDRDAIATILGTKVVPEAASNFGCIVSDPTTNLIRHYVEKPESHISNLINCGVYLFNAHKIFDEIKKAHERKAQKSNELTLDPLSLDSDDRLRLEQDLLAPLAQEQNGLYVYETRDFWRQIKTAGSAVPANALYLQRMFQSSDPKLKSQLTPPTNEGPVIIGAVYIHPTASIDKGAKIGPNVSIGAHTKVGDGVRIKDAIILDGSDIRVCIFFFF